MYIQSRCFGFGFLFSRVFLQRVLCLSLWEVVQLTVCFLLQLIASRDTVLVVRPSNCLIRCNLKTVQASSCPLHAIRYSSSKQPVVPLLSCLTVFASAARVIVAELMITWQVWYKPGLCNSDWPTEAQRSQKESEKDCLPSTEAVFGLFQRLWDCFETVSRSVREKKQQHTSLQLTEIALPRAVLLPVTPPRVLLADFFAPTHTEHLRAGWNHKRMHQLTVPVLRLAVEWRGMTVQSISKCSESLWTVIPSHPLQRNAQPSGCIGYLVAQHPLSRDSSHSHTPGDLPLNYI